MLAADAPWNLTDDVFVDQLLPLFPSSSPMGNENHILQSFTIDGSDDFTDRSVAALVNRCGSGLQFVRFANCQRLDPEATINAVGRGCKRLRSVAFVRRQDDDGFGRARPSPPPQQQQQQQPSSAPDADKSAIPNGHANSESRPQSIVRCTTVVPGDAPVVSALIRVAGAAELASVTFVGFRSVLDVDVGYLADCYQSTLRRVELAGCRLLSDVGLMSLAERCGSADKLRDVSFAATRVTDRGAAALAAACPRLRRVDLSRCAAVTDDGVRALAVGCRRLERVSFAGCRSVTERGLDALVRHCHGLQSIDVSRTSVAVVTPLVVALSKLSRLGLDECDRLVRPPQEVATRGLEAVRQYYKEYNPSCRFEKDSETNRVNKMLKC